MNEAVKIIAEAGVNHGGSLEMAKQLIDSAADSGADFVKFQTFRAEALVTRSAKKAEYQLRQDYGDDNQYGMLKNCELDQAGHVDLILHCRDRGIEFLSSPFDLQSIDLLVDLGIQIIKTPSGEITNKPYLIHVARQGKPVVMSTGLSSFDEVSRALQILITNGLDEKGITILHCNSQYPTPIDEVNLRAMTSMKSAFGVPIGLSDHTEGITTPIAAVALGACVIEKHLTLDKSLAGPDHAASLIPEEFKEMVSSIRDVEKAMGDGIKRPSPGELKNLFAVRKSIVASKKIYAGDLFSSENLAVKRPGSGISPMNWDNVVGTRSKWDFDIDELIRV
jgi:N,N'-diacetyllegionaminate synthase